MFYFNCSLISTERLSSYTFFSVFFFKQKTAYEMRISDWSSDVCSSDLLGDILHIRECITQQATKNLGAAIFVTCFARPVAACYVAEALGEIAGGLQFLGPCL